MADVLPKYTASTARNFMNGLGVAIWPGDVQSADLASCITGQPNFALVTGLISVACCDLSCDRFAFKLPRDREAHSIATR